jgi:hypothetical protein
MADKGDEKGQEKADPANALVKRAEQAAAAKKQAEGVGEWLQDTLADLQPYLQKIAEVRPMYLHRMDPAVATKVVDNEREIRMRQIDADLQKRDLESKSLAAQQEVFLRHERETARTDRREGRLIILITLVLLLGGGLALAFTYLGQPNLASTVLALLISVVTLLSNAFVDARRQRRRLPTAQRIALPPDLSAHRRDRVRHQG